MKPYALIFTFICMSSLFALAAPTNVRATAISQDAFTLRWNAVDSADGYEVEVKMAEQSLVIDEEFEGLTSFPDGWTEGGDYTAIINNKAYAHLGTYFFSIPSSGNFVCLPQSLNPSVLSFWVRSRDANHSFTLIIEESLDYEDWQALRTIEAKSDGTGEITNVYRAFTIDIDNDGVQNKYLRFRKSVGIPPVFIDDVQLYALAPDPLENLHPESAGYNATRITNLDPSTNYLHRVRATINSEQSDYSPWQITSTLAEGSPSSTGSAINNTPASITLPQIGSYPQQSIQIDPDLSDGDYAIEVEESAANTISYSITAANEELPGIYTISHPGFTASSLQVLGAELGDYQLSDGSSTIAITSFTGKGTMQIVLSMDETLPVEMGTMTLTHVGAHSLNLQWFSYSESNLLGYYVLRSAADELSQACRVSELIPATNSSTNTQYLFRDTDVEQSYYYWLEAMDYSGDQSYYGPEYYQMPAPGHVPPSVLRNALQSIYPNPFNPSTTISYSLIEQSPVHLSIYDTRGSLIHRHQESGQEAGLHSYIWNARNAASGVYFIRMQIGERSFERKMVLLK